MTDNPQTALRQRLKEHQAKLGPTTPTASPLPATFPTRSAFGRIAARRSDAPRASQIVGKILKFNGKTGIWVCGEQKIPIPDGTLLWVITMAEGWVLWEAGLTTGHESERPDGSLPSRDELQPPHDDPNLWPISSLTGKRKDPWERRICALATILGDGELAGEEITVIASNDSSMRAMRDLARRVAYYQEANPAATAIVRIGSFCKQGARTYQVPTLEIVDWRDAMGLPIAADDATAAEGVAHDPDPAAASSARPARPARRMRTLPEELDDEIKY